MQSAISGALPEPARPAHPADPGIAADIPRDQSPGTFAIQVANGGAFYEGTKRILDFTLGAIGLALTGFVSLIVVPLIMRKSPGGMPIFAQTRVGRGGKTFTCYKFRTMAPDAENRKRDLAHLNEVDAPAFKIAEDPRQVPALRWLRKYSIDEMPQFWNVVRGDMSLVGPRPPVPDEVGHYTLEQLARLGVKPGLTCTWQVNGRSDVGFEDWVAMDVDYIGRRSTSLDLKLIIQTIPAILSGRGAS